MKSLSLALMLFSLSTTASAQTDFAEYYLIEAWAGEYPTGYELVEDVEVQGVESPSNPIPTQMCTLISKSVIHPWAEKTKSEFASLHGVDRYLALTDFELFIDFNQSLKVKIGDEIAQLAYLSEGICLMSVNGTLAEDGCLSAEDKRVKILLASPLTYSTYFKTTCKEGHLVWVNSRTLEDSVTETGEYGVKHAEILDYGTVREP